MPTYYPRLCAMMFLQFGVYGLWLPIAGRFLTASPAVGGLGFTERQSGMIVGFAAAIGAMVSPWIVQYADRRFSAQKFLGLLMVSGGLLKIVTYYQTTFVAWLSLSIAFTAVFMPSAAICNAITMRHLQDPPRQWPAVRMWTAIAWVLVGWTFSFFVLTIDPAPHPLPPFFRGDPVPMPGAAMRQSVLWSGTLAILYGTLVFFWGPPSPPLATGRRVQRTPLREAFGLLRIRSFAVIVAATLVMSSVHVIYFIQCAKFLSAAGLRDAYIMPSMALGQLCEIGMYVVLGRMLPRFGFRTVISIGISCFVLRFALLGTVSFPLWVMVAAQALHGICFAFLFSACFIYTDKVAPRAIGNSAQSVYSFVFYGAGPVTGVFLNAFLAERFAGNAAILDLAGFSRLWYTLGVIAVLVLAFVIAFFRPEHLRSGAAASSELAPVTKNA